MRLRLIGICGAAGAALLGAAVFLRPAAAPSVTADGAIPVPSGQVVTLLDVVGNVPGPDGLTIRFRFLAPAIAREGGTIGVEAAMADMEALCNGYALPRITDFGPTPQQVVISLSDRAVPFGEAAPQATQYFEAFGIEGQSCIWAVF